jgi:hypothetical protein
MAPKKKPQSSVDLNRSKKPVSRTDAKGRTGMGASTASGKKPLPKDFGKRENELRTVLLSTVLGAKGGKKAVNESYTLGKTVVHASPAQGLKKINPRTGSVSLPNQSVNYSFNPKSFKGNQGVKNVVGQSQTYVQQYAGSGSVYVGKVPRGSIKKNVPIEAKGPGHVVASKPIKVKKEFNIQDPKIVSNLEKYFPKKAKPTIKENLKQKQLKKKLRTSSTGDIA